MNLFSKCCFLGFDAVQFGRKFTVVFLTLAVYILCHEHQYISVRVPGVTTSYKRVIFVFTTIRNSNLV